MEKYGGRKFVSFIIFSFLMLLNLLALAYKFVTENYAMFFITNLIAGTGIFVAGNIGEKYLKKGGTNEQQRVSGADSGKPAGN